MKAYTPPLCLWSLVQQHVPPHEQNEIKSMLGVSLVEQSQELHQEIETLLEIWREMREEATSVSVSPQSSLPEPPDQRDRLIQEICFFVNNVKDKAEEKGIDPQYILQRRNSQILDYAADLTTRPGSLKARASLASDGRETPFLPSTYSRDNLAHEMADELNTANSKLNYLEFDEVCESLRSTLEREVGQLIEDIQFLQSCLDCEADSRDNLAPQPTSREPTLSELREERSHLEKDLLATNKITAIPQVVKPSFNTSNTVFPLTPPGKSELSSQKTRPVPLKADHSVIGADGEIKSASSDIDLSSAVQTKDVPLSKPPIASTKQNGDSVNTSNVGPNIRPDKSTRHLMSNLIRNSSFAPNSPPQSPNRSDVDKFSRKPLEPQTSKKISGPSPDNKFSRKQLGTQISQRISGSSPDNKFSRKPLDTQISKKISGHSQPFSSTASSTTKHDGAKLTIGGVRRRTVSPARVRVVELTALVDTLTNREDSNVPELSTLSSSTASTIMNPSPPLSSLKVNSAMSPTSGHVERFRNMVLECRDGE